MTLNAFDPQQPADNVVGEISFADIVDFFLRSWKKLFAAAVSGALFGLSYSFLIGTYSAEYIFFNRIQNALEVSVSSSSDVSINEVDRSGSVIASTKPSIKNPFDAPVDNAAKINIKPNPFSLDLTEWKSIQKALPSVAEQVLASGKGNPEQISLYRELAEESWWRKNAIPTFLVVSKVDTKDVAGTIKDLDPDSFVLMSLTLTASGRSTQSALNNVQGAADFLRTAGSYIQVRSLLNSYEAESIGGPAEMQKRITNANNEIAFQQERFNQLEELRKRFPANSNTTQPILNPKDSGAKYLPISTQLIAIQGEINALRERLQRLEQKLKQLALIKSFMNQAKPLATETFNGLELSSNLLDIEAKLRLQLPSNEIAGLEALDRVRAQLLQIQGRFTKGIEPAALIKTSGISTAMAAGAVITFLIALLWILARQSWLNAKKLA